MKKQKNKVIDSDFEEIINRKKKELDRKRLMNDSDGKG